jgi:hypothetical protein
MEIPGFVGPSYTLRSKNVSCQRSVNIFPEMNEMDPKKWSLRHTPGLVKVSTAGTGPIRGSHRASNGRAFVVSGNEVYEITIPGTPVSKGTIDTRNGAVSFDDNATQLVIVDGVSGYVFDFTTNVLTKIADTDFPRATSVAFLDQYILANDKNSGRFQFSALNDATDWDGLDVATAEGSPDNLVALAVDHREIILFGDLTTEVWFNSGDADNPFLRINGAFIEHGIAGPHLHSLLDNTRLWWSKDKNGSMVAMRMTGYQGTRVSTFAIEELLQGLTEDDILAGTCWAYQDGGHTFWITNFPNAKSSVVFDASNGLWHERDFTDPETGLQRRHRAESHIYHASMHLVGDYENGNIYKLDDSVRSDNGVPSILQRIWPAPKAQGKRIFYHALELEMETGVGPEVPSLDDDGNPVPPQIMMQFSDDNGNTWSNEDWNSLGFIGERETRVRWQRLGSSRDRVFKVAVSDDVPVTMISAWLDSDAGEH